MKKNFKTMIAIGLAFATILGSMVTTWANPIDIDTENGNVQNSLFYADVKETDWFYEAVKSQYEEGIMVSEPMYFYPYNLLSRAQLVLILYRMEKKPKFETQKTFNDITGDEWYGPAVLWAAENGIVTGYENGYFGPADYITREQLAVVMYRYTNYLNGDVTTKADISKFADSDKVSDFATEALSWANGMGIITGKENGTLLDPQGNTARCEAAVIVQRFMENNP